MLYIILWLYMWVCQMLDFKEKSPPPTTTLPTTSLPTTKQRTFLTKMRQQAIMDNVEKRTSIAALHQTSTHVDFDQLDTKLKKVYNTTHKQNVGDGEIFSCYSCQENITLSHHHYIFCCSRCGKTFWRLRHATRNLHGVVAFVTGGRIKLGHQVVLRLLRCHASVVATTRNPQKAMAMFSQYTDSSVWIHRLYFLPLNLSVPDIPGELQPIYEFIDNKFGKLDIVVNCAAQTIRSRDSGRVFTTQESIELNRYGDYKYVPQQFANSWDASLVGVDQEEMEEIFRVNAVAPFLIFQKMLPLLECSDDPFLINVHAREGLFNVLKSCKHIHTNMGKAASAMFTRSLMFFHFPNSKKKVKVHGCDPGWISIDEYYKDGSVWIVPPLDERDGAARILYPLMQSMKTNSNTRRHYFQIIN